MAQEPAALTPSVYVPFLKPALDRVLGALLLVASAPLLAVVALAIRASMGSPVMFRQARVGLRGSTFVVHKFRTMQPDRRIRTVPVAVERRVTHKSPTDPRLTPLGRVLRRWSLDELPQLWNVVNGTMSLVGPRPELVSVVAGYEPWQHRRHEVKPGLTGLWQVSARGDRAMHESTEVDLEYVDRISAGFDLRLLLRTVPAALFRQRGY